MVQIVEHLDFLPEDFVVEEAAASSTPRATNLPALGATAAVHSSRQHTPAQTSRASRVVPGALSAARELLRHPPSSTAFPGAMKKWPDPRARTRAQPLKMTNSASPDPRARTRAQPRKTMNSASPDPRARTRAQPRKTTNSAPPDPGLGLGLSSGRRRTPLRPTPGLGLSPSLSRRSPPRPTRGLGLDLGLGR
jgi:hypothetical protein